MSPEHNMSLGESRGGLGQRVADFLTAAVSWSVNEIARRAPQVDDEFPYDPLSSVDM